MNRAFIVNLLFLVAINVLIKPFYLFGIDRVVQNTVPDGAYGLYFSFLNLTYLFQIINDFGIQNFNNRNIAQHNQLLEKYFSNILMLKTGLSILSIMLILAVAILLGYQLQQFPLLILIAFNQVLVSFIFYLRSNISGLGHYRLDSIFSVSDKLLMILICGILLYSPIFQPHFTIEWFVWSQTASLLITASLAFLWVSRRIRQLRFRFKPAMLLLIIRKSYPFSLIILFMAIYTRTDGVMIERLLTDGAVEADRYASAFRLLDASNMVALLFATLLLPMLSKLLAQQSSIDRLVYLGLQTIWGGAVSGAMAVYFYRTEIMELLYDNGGPYSGAILGYLMLTFMAMSATYIFGTLLVANNNIRPLNILFAGSVVVNIVLNLLLIPQYKAQGAAIATLITQLGVTLGECLLSYRLTPLNLDLRVYFRTAALFVGAFLIHHTLLAPTALPWNVKFFTGIGISLILSFILRLIDLPYWIQLIKEKPLG